MARTEGQNAALRDALLTSVKQQPMAAGMSHEQHQRAADAALGNFRVGNFDEAAQKGVETVAFGQPLGTAFTGK